MVRVAQTGPPAPLLTSAQQIAIAISAFRLFIRLGDVAPNLHLCVMRMGTWKTFLSELPTLKQRNDDHSFVDSGF